MFLSEFLFAFSLQDGRVQPENRQGRGPAAAPDVRRALRSARSAAAVRQLERRTARRRLRSSGMQMNHPWNVPISRSVAIFTHFAPPQKGSLYKGSKNRKPSLKEIRWRFVPSIRRAYCPEYE